MARITIISDTDEYQINGVVTTYKNTIKQTRYIGHQVHMFDSAWGGKRIALPWYKEVLVSIQPWKIKPILDSDIRNKSYIHIATEGPMGLFARLYLSWKKYPFTTCYHTKFPEFIENITKIPARFFYPYFRWFHSKSKCVMVPTEGMREFLISKGFNNVKVWTRGVDTDTFYPENIPGLDYIVCVSRVSKEKNLDAFCQLNYPMKVLVGDGPYLEELKKKYPNVIYMGKLTGDRLRRSYTGAKCFVFPSKEDTFGVVLLEAIACGTPIAAYPEPGPKEIINKYNGVMSDNLEEALLGALKCDRDKVHESSKKWTWEAASKQFLDNIWVR
jgi:glycosyltransferase involved in cell wall biosynthesis